MIYGCTSLFNLAHRAPILMAAIGLTGIANHVANPGPGERYGTADELAKLERKLVTERSELAVQAVHLRVRYDKLNPKPTEDQVRQVLKRTDSCTDVNVRDVMNRPEEVHTAGWILYLDTVSKEGSEQADLLFVSN